MLDLCGRTTLPQLAALAAESDVFLSNDTGPLHLGGGGRGAGGRRLHLHQPRGSTAPTAPRAVAVQTGVWCAASYVKACDRLECMAELTPDRVWPVVLAQLDAGRDAGISAA